MSVTHTRTHVNVTWSNPYNACDLCKAWVEHWHDDGQCGCDAGDWLEPCGHRTGATSACPSWGPVDGCECLAVLGEVPHAEPPARAAS